MRAFEFYNPGPPAIDHILPRPFGVVRIAPGEYVPTPEQEAQGLKAECFEDLVPSHLRRTPPATRKRLLEEAVRLRRRFSGASAAERSSPRRPDRACSTRCFGQSR